MCDARLGGKMNLKWTEGVGKELCMAFGHMLLVLSSLSLWKFKHLAVSHFDNW